MRNCSSLKRVVWLNFVIYETFETTLTLKAFSRKEKGCDSIILIFVFVNWSGFILIALNTFSERAFADCEDEFVVKLLVPKTPRISIVTLYTKICKKRGKAKRKTIQTPEETVTLAYFSLKRVWEECELRVASCSCELRVASCELRVASCELRVASCELRVASCELRVAVASCELQLRVARCQRRVARCQRRVASCDGK